jgi:hypothetical protein
MTNILNKEALNSRCWRRIAEIDGVCSSEEKVEREKDTEKLTTKTLMTKTFFFLDIFLYCVWVVIDSGFGWFPVN